MDSQDEDLYLNDSVPVDPLFMENSKSDSQKENFEDEQPIFIERRKSTGSLREKKLEPNFKKTSSEILDLTKYIKEDNNQNNQNNNNNQNYNKSYKKPPHFKLIPETNWMVDGFQFKSPEYSIYFLSHFHSDHYVGLTKTFNFGKIYCSHITGELVKKKLVVEDSLIFPLEINKVHKIDDHEVILIDANHCPGAVVFLFRLKNGKNVLHTGDFRYYKELSTNPFISSIRLDYLYLDNTFSHPDHTFPAQSDCIKRCVEIAKKVGNEKLILVGSYLIGKERVAVAIAKELGVKIFVTVEKYEYLKICQFDMNTFTLNPNDTNLHFVNMNDVSFRSMVKVWNLSKMKYNGIVGIQPTGWAYGKSINSQTYRKSGFFELYCIPYSEHSSHIELKQCIADLKPTYIVPTVDCSTPEKVQAILKHLKGKNPQTNLLGWVKNSAQSAANVISSTVTSLLGAPKQNLKSKDQTKNITNFNSNKKKGSNSNTQEGKLKQAKLENFFN